MGGDRASLDVNIRASLDDLKHTRRRIKDTLSDLQKVLNQWTPRIDEVRARQEGKLDKILERFEQAARDGVDVAFESSVAPFRLVSAFGYSWCSTCLSHLAGWRSLPPGQR